jgi:hypothetical protein
VGRTVCTQPPFLFFHLFVFLYEGIVPGMHQCMYTHYHPPSQPATASSTLRVGFRNSVFYAAVTMLCILVLCMYTGCRFTTRTARTRTRTTTHVTSFAHACRLQFALSTCMRQQIHAERLVSTLLDHYKLAAELIPFYFFRVRQNGVLEARDFKPRWKAFAIPKCDLPMFKPFEDREKQLLAQAAAESHIGKNSGRKAGF